MNNFPIARGVIIGDRDFLPGIRERHGIGGTPGDLSEIQVRHYEAPEI
jgi:hypothetical protein